MNFGNPSRAGLSDDAALRLALGIALFWAIVLPQFRPLLPVDETRYLTVAWEMQQSGTYALPHLNGDIYGHKPPLLFWLINLVWSVTGVSEIAARLVAPAFGVLAVWLTAQVGRQLFSRDAGQAALILAGTGIFALYGSLTMFDTMLACATLLGVRALLVMDRNGGFAATLMLAVALAFGVFAKGPVILIHLGPLALLQPVWGQGRGYGRWLLRVLAAVGLTLLPIALWLFMAWRVGGDAYLDEVVWRQSAGRMVNSFDHARPIWFFVALLPVLVWPWGWRIAALRGLAGGWGQDRNARVLAIWAGGSLLLFSLISGKQVHYMLPMLPALALALSRLPVPQSRVWPLLASAIVTVPVVIWLALIAVGKTDFEGATLPMSTVIITGLAAVAVLAVLALAARKGASLALVAPLTLLVVHIGLSDPLHQVHDTERFAAELGKNQSAGIGIAGYRYQGEFGFTARLTVPVETVDPAQVQAWAKSHPGGLLMIDGKTSFDAAPIATLRLGGDDIRLYRLP